jgi:hypothetical protein
VVSFWWAEELRSAFAGVLPAKCPFLKWRDPEIRTGDTMIFSLEKYVIGCLLSYRNRMLLYSSSGS